MIYVSHWERLSDALTRVIKKTSLSKDDAQKSICQAIGDGAIKIRGKLDRHQTKGLTSQTIHDGQDFQIPPSLAPENLDWERSRPTKAWILKREYSHIPGLWILDWIELFRADVTSAFRIQERQPTDDHAAPKSLAAMSRKPARERVLKAIRELHPDGVPDPATEPNKLLCQKVANQLKISKLPSVSNDTILRAAGRRK